MIKLIVNADDFGINEAVNRGIERAFRYGFLTNTTFLANGPAFEDAVARIKKYPEIKIGIHLNIVRGEPVSDSSKVRSLLDKDGLFMRDVKKISLKLVKKNIRIIELERELRAQIEKILKKGINITHIDSEKHLHCLPSLLKIIVKLSKEYGIERIRIINERLLNYNTSETLLKKLFNPQYRKALILNSLCNINRKILDKNGIRYPDEFFGVLCSGKMTQDNYRCIFSALNSGVTEIMCHAGYNINNRDSLKSFGEFYLNAERENELKALLDPELKKVLQELGIVLINYGDLK